MVVASPTTTNLRSQSNPKRPPLLPSDREFNSNNNNNNVAIARRPKAREVSSRYLSTSSSSSTSGSSSSNFSNSSYFSPSSRRRCPSPLPAATVPATPAVHTAPIKRSQSVERRVYGTPRVRGERIHGEMSAAAKMLISSSRSLSVSFQGGTTSNSTKKSMVSASPVASVRRVAPEKKVSDSRRMTRGDNTRVIEQHQQPWPGRIRPPVSSLSRSVDLGGFEGKKSMNGSSTKVVRALQESLDGDCNTSKDESLKGVRDDDGSSLGSESIVSDRESVLSECNSRSQDDSSSNASIGRSSKASGRGIVVPAKFLQEVSSSRSRDSGGSPVGRSNLLKGNAPPRLVAPKRLMMDNQMASPRGSVSSRGLSSPLSGSLRPSSPSPMPTSPSKVGSSLRPSSPAKLGSSLRPASPAKVGSTIRPSSPAKVGSSTIRPSSPAKVGSTVRPSSPAKAGSSTIRPSSPAKVGSSIIRPSSPAKVGSSTIRPSIPAKVGPSPASRAKVGSSPSTTGVLLRSASPSRMGASLQPGTPSRVGEALRYASPGKVGASLRPASPSSSKVGASLRPASPNKFGASLASEKGLSSCGVGRMASPSRVRNPIAGASVLCLGADVRRVKVGDNRLGDAHLLRILYNRHLQWLFVNARAEASLSVQKLNSERSLYNAWRATLDLRERVSSKRKELQWLKQNLKLMSILKGQMVYLEEWALMVKDHCSSLTSAIESIKASTVRLPLVSGAKADIRDLKDAICSAADVMHSMASSICSLSEKVEKVNSLVGEVACLTLKEQSYLDECKSILSMLAALQVKDCSLRAHVLQQSKNMDHRFGPLLEV